MLKDGYFEFYHSVPALLLLLLLLLFILEQIISLNKVVKLKCSRHESEQHQKIYNLPKTELQFIRPHDIPYIVKITS